MDILEHLGMKVPDIEGHGVIISRASVTIPPPSQPAPGPRLATISAALQSDDTKPDMQKCFMIVDIKVSKDPL